MEDVLSKAKYKIPSEAADKAFAMMDLGDKFRLDYGEYREFYENLVKKLETQGSRTAVTRDFRNMGEKMSRKISMSMKGAAIRAGYRKLQDGTFDRTLGKAWEEILKRKSGRRGQKARKKRKKKKAKYKAPAGVYTQPKLRERIHATLLNQNTHGTAAGEWSARKSQELNRRYQKAGGGFVNKK
tara:strand:- start:946 stop:1497 length:552 start_codon:yes stop_codon:yes gene_type:complete